MESFGHLLEKQVYKRLAMDNPWWTTSEVDCYYTDMPHRIYLDSFVNEVTNTSLRRAVVLMGPRRIGKTVMIFHTISRLLKAGVDPRKIIYLSLDTPVFSNIALEQLFLYAKNALHQPENAGGYFVFFDEIQYLKNWEVHLKSMVDSYRHDKFIASGSAAAALKMKSNESGAGRFTDFTLPPLTFLEYLRFKKHDLLVTRDTTNGFDTIDITKLNALFIEYINYGGYPEVVFSDAIRLNPGQYIKNDIIDKVLLRDLPGLYGITDVQDLNKLFVHIAFRSGCEFSFETLSTESGIKKETLKKYIQYLEAAFLIKVVYRIDQNAKRLQRLTTFKIYLTNPSLRCALFTPITEGDDFMGSMVETAIFSQWFQTNDNNLYYANWHNGRNKGEVDMVWLSPITQQPTDIVEIKWTDRYFTKSETLKSLKTFLSLHPTIKKTIVTTETESGETDLDEGQHIRFIPSALYAYMIDQMVIDKVLKQ